VVTDIWRTDSGLEERFTEPLAFPVATVIRLRDGSQAPGITGTRCDQRISRRNCIAGVRSPRRGRKPAHWTRIDRDYETLRTGMQTLFHDLGIATPVATAA
jgi:hypothetical protein